MTAASDASQVVASGWELVLAGSLRKIRKENGLTLVELGRKTGLSPSFLSQLERGLTRASLPSLALLAEALGSTAASLLSGAQKGMSETVSFMQAGDAPAVQNRAGLGYVIVNGQRPIQPMLLVGGQPEFGPNHVVHIGDEFIYVIAGKIQFELVGEGLFDLGPGDSLYFRGGIKHRWRQRGKRECRFLSVIMDH